MRPLFLLGLFGGALVALPSPAVGPPAAKVTRLTRDGGFKQHLQWSPDGARLLMTRIHKGVMGLWTMKADGSDLKPLVVPGPKEVNFDGHYSRDGKKVVFVLDVHHGTDGKLQINTCDADGKNSKAVITHKAFEESPRFSPDGQRIAWVSTRFGNQEICSAAADGGDLKRLTNDAAMDNNPAWSPDGKKIAFASSRH